MKTSTLITLLVVLALAFLGLWQFSTRFRVALGLTGRPFDFAFGTMHQNNVAAVPVGQAAAPLTATGTRRRTQGARV